MKRSRQLITLSVLLSGLYFGATGHAHAISEAYRKQLEQSGCTQVSEANGSCQLHNPRAHDNHSRDSQHNGPAAEVARSLERLVTGKYQGQAVDIMQAQGWERTRHDGTRWKKAGFVASLTISQKNNRVTGVSVIKAI